MTFSNPGSGWRGYSVQARSVDEVKTAIDHHLGNYLGNKHSGAMKSCPLCRDMSKVNHART